MDHCDWIGRRRPARGLHLPHLDRPAHSRPFAQANDPGRPIGFHFVGASFDRLLPSTLVQLVPGAGELDSSRGDLHWRC